MSLTIVPAKATDVFSLVLRPEDSLEVSPGWEFGVRDAVTRFGGFSAFDAEGLVAMFGVTEGATWLSPWLLSSSRISNYPKQVMRTARAFTAKLVEEGRAKDKFIFNNIPKDAEGNRRFVAALGFVFQPTADAFWDTFYHPSCVNPLP